MEENNNYGCLHVHVRNACGICAPTCMHAVYVCLHGMHISCLIVVCIYKMFHHTETYSLFYSSKTRSQKMLKTTEQESLKISTDIDHSLTFSKVSRPNICRRLLIY